MRRILLAATAVLLLVPAAAPAATLRATADGSDGATACTVATPCSLGRAIDLAAHGDTVLLAPGQYTREPPILVEKAITIAGDPAQPRPVIDIVKQTHGFGAEIADGTVVRHVTFTGRNPGPGTNPWPLVYLRTGAVLEDAEVIGGDRIWLGAYLEDAHVRDTVVRSTSPDATFTGVKVQGSSTVTASTVVADVGLNAPTGFADVDAAKRKLRGTLTIGIGAARTTKRLG